jgi:hypothetical protein
MVVVSLWGMILGITTSLNYYKDRGITQEEKENSITFYSFFPLYHFMIGWRKPFEHIPTLIPPLERDQLFWVKILLSVMLKNGRVLSDLDIKVWSHSHASIRSNKWTG